MPNHLHMLAYSGNSEKAINDIKGTDKRFMAYEIVKRLEKFRQTGLVVILI